MSSIWAEAGTSQSLMTMLYNAFFLPLTANNPPDLGGAIFRGGHKMISTWAEVGI
ncbi:hypothetical protein NX720_01550 [Endozoicomonas euniceicola]|uniref:Uncharacterized protein n=1 Tax=Endozoicomonas euniceicola TaxID=1234143 RepID=A0ABY6GW57_9GAMM|nr:hypothetical protein [Endozoicomonas euniceicola]UYM16644.1 hypothetical protein NX720_01550 [Endozoicomonas euniceicola]